MVCSTTYAAGEKFCSKDGGAIVAVFESADPLIGQIIAERYQVRRLIGRGGMGAVYEAAHLGLDTLVAIKFLQRDDDRDAAARFRREAQAASKLSHDNIIRVFDVGATATHEFIVMELFAGRDLSQVIEQDGQLRADRAITIARQMLAGLGAIHVAGLVHRDIKPGNVLVGPDDRVKVMDFGISKTMAIGDDTITGADRVIGTPQYMSPEQLAGGTVDGRADLYGAGLTIYAMLAGAPPFSGNTFSVVAAQHLHHTPRPLDELRPDLPAPLVAAVARALEKSPTARFAKAETFATALTELVSDERTGDMTAAQRPSRKSLGASEQVPSRARGRTVLGVLAVVVVATSIAVVAWTQLRDRGEAAAEPDHTMRALQAERAGKLELALAEYGEAYALQPSTDALYRMGELSARLGRNAEATSYFERYLAAAPTGRDHDEVTRRLAMLRPASPPADAAVPDATSVALAPPIPSHVPSRTSRRAAPDAAVAATPHGVGSAVAVAGELDCTCRGRFPDGTTSPLCERRRTLPNCLCEAGDQQLCPVRWRLESQQQIVHEPVNSSWYCVDTSAPGCDVFGTKPDSCDLNSWGTTPNKSCAGYAPAQQSTSDSPMHGKVVCNYCERSGRFSGSNGDPCEGYQWRTGTKLQGVLDKCFPRRP